MNMGRVEGVVRNLGRKLKNKNKQKNSRIQTSLSAVKIERVDPKDRMADSEEFSKQIWRSKQTNCSPTDDGVINKQITFWSGQFSLRLMLQ